MSAHLRIAVLECDTPPPNASDRYNGYGGMFQALFQASAKFIGHSSRLDSENGPDISQWDVVNGQKYPTLEDIDAVLITGSSWCTHRSTYFSTIYADHTTLNC